MKRAPDPSLVPASSPLPSRHPQWERTYLYLHQTGQVGRLGLDATPLSQKKAVGVSATAGRTRSAARSGRQALALTRSESLNLRNRKKILVTLTLQNGYFYRCLCFFFSTKKNLEQCCRVWCRSLRAVASERRRPGLRDSRGRRDSAPAADLASRAGSPQGSRARVSPPSVCCSFFYAPNVSSCRLRFFCCLLERLK